MSRRYVALALALVLVVLVPAGALSGVFASDTTGSGLLIDAADGPNGAYADLSNDELTLDLANGGGVSNNAVTRLDAVFTVTNDRSYAAPVWVTDNSSAVSFYDTDTGASVESRANALNLTPGESLVVGVSVDTREASVADVEAADSFSVETLVEEAETPTTDAPDASDAPDTADPSDTPGGATETNNTSTPTPAPDDNTTATPAPDGDDSGNTQPPGGGQGGGTSESSYSVTDTNEGATVNVREGLATDPFTADLTQDASYATGAGTTVESLPTSLTFDRDRWRMEVTDPTASPQNAPAFDGTGEATSYVRLDAYGVEASAFDRVGVNVSVSDLPSGTDPSQVTLYRHTDAGWEAVSTRHLGGERYTADLGGFGELAVVVEPASGGETGGIDTGTGETGTDTTPNDDATTTPTDTNSSTPTPTETTDANQPDGGETPTATAVERLQDPLTLDQGLGGPTVVVFGAFSLWLAARSRFGGGGGGSGGGRNGGSGGMDRL